MKRFISLLLVILMLSTALVSCKPASKKEKVPEKQRLENVYLTTEYSMPEKIYSAQMVESGGTVFMMARRENNTVDEEGNEVYNNEAVLYVTNNEFASYNEIAVLKNENNWNAESTSASGISPNRIYSSNDGNVIVLYNKWHEDWSDEENYIYEQNWSLEKLSPDGSVISSLDFDFSTIETDYFYVSDIILLENGKYFVISDMAAYIVSPEGKVEKECEIVDNFNSAAKLNDGRFIIFYYDDNWDFAYGEYNLDTEEFRELGAITEYYGTPIVTEDGRLFIPRQTDLVEYNLETGEEIGVEINWLNSDINPNYVGNLIYMNGIFYNIDQSEWLKPKLMKLTPCDDVIEKYVIDLACLYLDYEITEKIIEFNRSNEEHRIVVKTYNEIDAEGNQKGIEKLDNDIIQGNIPDIISLDSLDFNKYASKGLLADLNPLLDADKDLSREDLLENIIEFGSMNGKLYTLITSFGIGTVIGKTSVVGDRNAWTWKDLNDTLAKYPGSVAFSQMIREDLLRQIMSVSLYDFIDYTTGSTKFDTDEFRAILEFCKPYPETIDWDEYYEDYDWEVERQNYRDNKILLQTRYFSSYWDLAYDESEFDEPYTMIGYPTSGTSGSTIQPAGEWAITEQCPFKEKAFDFLKLLVSEEAAEDIYMFSTNKKAFEEGFEEFIKDENSENDVMKPVDMPTVDVATDADIAVEDVIADNDFLIEEPIYQEDTMTREEADKFIAFVKGVTRRQAPYDHEIIDIIVEEAAIYFAGEKSVEETSKIIQSRAFLYVTENM